MISAIVLGAGLSQRMGAFKQLLPYGDHTVIEQVVSVLLACAIDQVVVVTGHRHPEVEQVLQKWNVRVSFNPNYIDGMLTSLQYGWRVVPRDTTAVMHVLGDQPQIEKPVVAQLIAHYRAQNAGIVVPVFGGRRGHPILLSTRYRDEILALGKDATMRDIMRGHAHEVREVAVATDSILRDMDTWSEYEREISFRQAVVA
jgi:molybdenum cofactor cytidylyltransferase